MTRATTVVALVMAVLAGAGCAGDDDTSGTVDPVTSTTLAAPPSTASTSTTAAPSTTTSPSSTTSTSSTSSTIASTTTTTTEVPIEIPVDELVAVPTQNREDPAKNQFQIQIHNGTDERFDVTGVQFVWDGYTTELVERSVIIVGGQIIDLPVPFPGATCVGDGTRATMPPLDDARVRLVLEGGDEREVPVVDKWHVARTLYEQDCERANIERQLAIEWVDLHEEQFEGRPVTAGELRLTRREGLGTYTVLSVSNTIPFVFSAVETAVGEPVITLAEGEDVAAVPVRFLESRCDPHALAEVKQPTKFVAQIQLPDGNVRPYIIYPERSYWTPMRTTADKACVALGKVEFVGD